MNFSGAVCMEDCFLKNAILRNLEIICDKVINVKDYSQLDYIGSGVCVVDLEGIERTKFLRMIQKSGQDIGVFSICGYSVEDIGISEWYNEFIVERFWKPVRVELLINKIALYKQKVLLHHLGEKFNKKVVINPLIGTIKYDYFSLFLTPLEYKTFEQLLLNEGNIVTKEQLLLAVRCENQYISLASLYSIIWRIRKKIRNIGFPANIKAMARKGYCLMIGKNYGMKYLPGFEPQNK